MSMNVDYNSFFNQNSIFIHMFLKLYCNYLNVLKYVFRSYIKVETFFKLLIFIA